MHLTHHLEDGRMRHRVRFAAALSVVLLVAGVTATTSLAGTRTPRSASVSAVSAIPWGAVGPGWLLGVWTPQKPLVPGQKPPKGYNQSPPQSVFLISPEGVRYLVVQEPNSRQFVVAWSSDGQRVLQQSASRFSQIDLATGRAFDHFSLPSQSSNFSTSVSYSNPRGLALLVLMQRGEQSVLQRYSLTGKLQLTYPYNFGSLGSFTSRYTESPNGAEIAMGAPHGVAIVSNTGAVLAKYVVPRAKFCTPTRWWSSTIVLASCGSYTPRLYEIHVDTGAVNDLTATPRSPDFGDENAWQTHPGVYVQDAGACGYQYMGKLGPNHRTTPVAVPGIEGSVFILGAANHELALSAAVPCGPSTSLSWYDPALNTDTVVLGPPLMGGSVREGLSFPGT